jgi:hypothetical protein
MTTAEEGQPTEESILYAMHIKTPDHVFGWVIIIDDEATIRVAVAGNRVLEKVIIGDQQTSVGYEAWDMVIHTLGLTGPRDEYEVTEVSTKIPHVLTERILSAESDLEQNAVISDLAVYIGKELIQ